MLDRLRYRSIRRVTGVLGRLRRRLTPAGWLWLGALIVAGMFGLDTGRSMSFQAFSLSAAVMLFSFGSGLFFRTRFRIERRLPKYGTAGQPLRYAVKIVNEGRSEETGLWAAEDLVASPPTFEAFRAAGGPEDREAAFVERVSGYSRWRRLERGFSEPERRELPALAPGASCEVAMELRPAARGRLRLKAVDLFRLDPFGLVRSFRRIPRGESVLILPKRYPVGRLALPGGRIYQQGGVSLASSVGESQEFLSLRDYRAGDPLRRVHWRSWAKTGRLVVKEFQDEFFTRHALLLDTFGPSGEIFEEAVSAAASFAAELPTQESLLDLMFVADRAYRFTAGRGLGGAETILSVLAGVGPARSGGIEGLERAALARAGRISAAVAVLLGWDEARRGLVRRLRESGIPVLALAVLPRGSGRASHNPHEARHGGASAPPGRASHNPHEARHGGASAPPGQAAEAGVRFLEAGRLAEGLAGFDARECEQLV